VISQHQYLAEGGDRPGPALAARCEAIVAARPEIAEDRRRTLNDPWDRALTKEIIGYTPGIASLYDPEDLKRKVDYANKLDDPFSRVSLENDQWRRARCAEGQRLQSDRSGRQLTGRHGRSPEGSGRSCSDPGRAPSKSCPQ
jgi:hypothetical protein